jgi:NAD+ kinase
MKKVGIVSNLSKDSSGENTEKIIHGILSRNMQPMVTTPVYQLLGLGTLLGEKELYQLSDCILVLGGDGTILQTARQAAIYRKPILGINLGRLGFLAEAEMSDYDFILDTLAAGTYKTERRMMLEAVLIREGRQVSRFIALNDVAVAKASFARIIHLKAEIDGEFVSNYAADGILVSSPTGSTAYSLSAGGPVIYPSMECLLLTPVCPHTLNSRPIVTKAGSSIAIEVVDRNRDIQLTIDGQEAVDLRDGDKILISRSDLETQLIRLSGYSFFNLLRSKLSTRLD